MSIADRFRSAPNPAQKFIKFKNGKFQYWDKEKEQNIEVPLPVQFDVVDELATVTGWHDSSQSGVYSNEVHNTGVEQLNVRSFKGGDIARGFYGEIKDTAKAAGGRYTKSVYALLDGELVNFHFTGAALSAWIGKEKGEAYEVKELEEGKKGATTYKIPVFAPTPLQDEKKALEVYEELKTYLVEYKKKNTQEGDSVVEAKPKSLEGKPVDPDFEKKPEYKADDEELPF